MNWQDDAECKDSDPNLFFPEEEDPEREDKVNKAKEICSGCPVRDRCLEQGLIERFGVWGGLDELERIQLKRQNAKQKKS